MRKPNEGAVFVIEIKEQRTISALIWSSCKLLTLIEPEAYLQLNGSKKKRQDLLHVPALSWEDIWHKHRHEQNILCRFQTYLGNTCWFSLAGFSNTGPVLDFLLNLKNRNLLLSPSVLSASFSVVSRRLASLLENKFFKDLLDGLFAISAAKEGRREGDPERGQRRTQSSESLNDFTFPLVRG